MKTFMLCFLLLVASLNAAAADLEGVWRATYAGPEGSGWLGLGPMLLDLSMKDGQLSGTATVGIYPGKLKITAVKVDGQKTILTTVGEPDSKTGHRVTCYLELTGGGEEIEVVISFLGRDDSAPKKRYPFVGRKVVK